ncbi:MAG: hypothetical protein DWQ34_19615 [Planctomycetota bacterium]|nr:MAG: hypothetical protein DWQ29_14865 [Planctomycetota bacterium]REJ89465.1 MAG: hypothetical protein DWQ34_19615 [Planctomycetota bacterium]REK28965.1 MAG: hypothetical protein DWQ41_05310 [Planctomycetota bacterium]REK39602.1 MAG: hypothetical protein DWQ45_01640 [Planctomycetota bacterium]
MWFTETPWPPIFILAVIAACLAAAFSATQRSVYLAGILVLALLGGGIYFIEKQIVTERERVEAAIYGVADAFQRRDVAETVGYISQNAVLLRLLVLSKLREVQVREDLRITDVSIETSNQDSRATSHFRANGTFAVAGYGDVGHQPTRWEVDWQKEGGEWRIINVRRLDPINGDVMKIDERAVRSE